MGNCGRYVISETPMKRGNGDFQPFTPICHYPPIVLPMCQFLKAVSVGRQVEGLGASTTDQHGLIIMHYGSSPCASDLCEVIIREEFDGTGRRIWDEVG